jgi:coenzyme Q-binding protein COQ10
MGLIPLDCAAFPAAKIMPTHAEKRFLPYRPAQLFELVASVDRYPEFLPWCIAARIRSREPVEGASERTMITADLIIGFRMIRERFTSRVTLSPPDRIDVNYSEGPFRYLNNHWTFQEVPPGPEHPGGGTMLDFYVDFEFHSKLLQSLMAMLFNEAVKRMVHAFEARAKQLYGSGTPVKR